MTAFARHDLCIMVVSTAGTGSPLTLAGATSGFLALPAEADGKTLRYSLRDGVNSETCYGVYTHSGTTITRVTEKSTNADSPIDLSGNASAVFGAHAADILGFEHVAPIAASESAGDITLDLNIDSADRRLVFTRTLAGDETLLDPVDMPDGATIYLDIDPDGNTLTFDTGYVGDDFTNGTLPAVATRTLMAIMRRGSVFIAVAVAEA